jgi:hypothetical protein
MACVVDFIWSYLRCHCNIRLYCLALGLTFPLTRARLVASLSLLIWPQLILENVCILQCFQHFLKHLPPKPLQWPVLEFHTLTSWPLVSYFKNVFKQHDFSSLDQECIYSFQCNEIPLKYKLEYWVLQEESANPVLLMLQSSPLRPIITETTDNINTKCSQFLPIICFYRLNYS